MTQNKSYDANTLFAAIAIIPFLVPNGLQTFSFMRIVYDLKYLSFIIIALLTFGNGKIRRKGNDLILAIISFALIMIVISALQKTNVADAVTRMFNLLFPVLWINYMLKRCERKTLRGLIIYYAILSIINCGIILVNPEGIIATQSSNKTFLIGIDNKMVFTLLPILGISIFYIEKFLPSRNRKRNIAIATVIFASSLLAAWAANGMMAVLIMFFLLYFDKKGFEKFLNLRNGIIAIGVICFLVVFSNFFSQGLFAEFITNVLHKDVTFSGRSVLWAQTLKLVYQSPIYGYGIGSDVSNSFYFWSKGEIISGFSTHNGYLRILLEGGIIALVSYVMIYVVLYKSCKSIWNQNRGIRVLTYCTLGLLLTFIFEAEFYSTSMLFVLGMIYYYSQNDGLKYSIDDYVEKENSFR